MRWVSFVPASPSKDICSVVDQLGALDANWEAIDAADDNPVA